MISLEQFDLCALNHYMLYIGTAPGDKNALRVATLLHRLDKEGAVGFMKHRLVMNRITKHDKLILLSCFS